MTRLVICRHGDPARSAHDVTLTRAFSGASLAAVYTSPLPRAVTTAAALAEPHALTPIEIRDLREIEFGDVEGLPFDEWPVALQRGVLERPARIRFPGGETFPELRRRVVAAFEAIMRSHSRETVAVITHAGAIRAALAAWLLMDDTAAFRIDQRYGAVNIVDWTDAVPFVRLVNADADSRPLEFDAGASRAVL